MGATGHQLQRADRRAPPSAGPDAPGTRRLQDALLRLGPLPALSAAAQAVVALAEDPSAEEADLVAAIERDEALTSNLLRAGRVANRGRHGAVTGVPAALRLIGREGLRRVAQEAATYSLLERSSSGDSRGQMHAHAVAVAAMAAELAARTGQDVAAAHLAGLLHDVGKVVMPLIFGDDALAGALNGTPCGPERAERERAALGIDHAAAGAALAGAWGLDARIVAAIATHHRDEPEGGIPGCVQAANEATRLLTGQRADATLLRRAMARLGLGLETLEELVEGRTGVGDGRDALGRRMRELERRATTDDLTGIATRRPWQERVAAALAAGAGGSVVLVDVDRFKQVNDHHGHAAGDAVLVAVASLLSAEGLAGRIGGDEFALWLEGDPDDAVRVAQALCDGVGAATAAATGGDPVGISLGVAHAPRDGTALGDLLKVADAALYRAKGAGRGRVAEDARHPGGPAPAPRPSPGTAGEALRVLLAAHLPPGVVEARANDDGDGARCRSAIDRAVAALCADEAAVDVIVRHCLSPTLLANGVRCMTLAAPVGCRLGMDDDRLRQLAAAALLADVGMALVDPSLVAKPGRLTDAERREVMRHPELGAELLAPLAERWPVAPAVALQHHERWDGAGYPAGRRGEAIAVEARIVSVGHRFLAAVQPRPHRPAMQPHEAVELLYALTGALVDEAVIRGFVDGVALYPTGSYVRLSDGRIGAVSPGGPPARPRVRVIWRRGGERLAVEETVDLLDHPTLFIDALADAMA